MALHLRIEEALNDILHVPGNPEHAASARAGLLICDLSGLNVCCKHWASHILM